MYLCVWIHHIPLTGSTVFPSTGNGLGGKMVGDVGHPCLMPVPFRWCRQLAVVYRLVCQVPLNFRGIL